MVGCIKLPKELVPRDYAKWIENTNNGLRIEKEIGDYIFDIQYKPLDYAALLEIKKDSVSKQEIEKIKKEMEGLQYYTLKISAKNFSGDILKYKLNDMGNYSKRVEYFSFGMQNDLKIIEQGDTLPCTLHHFERSYGLSPYITFDLGFQDKDEKKEKKESDEKIVYYNDSILGIGPIKIAFKNKDIQNIPRLKTY